MAQAAEASSTFKIVLPPGLHFLTDVVAVVGADTTRGQLARGERFVFILDAQTGQPIEFPMSDDFWWTPAADAPLTDGVLLQLRPRGGTTARPIWPSPNYAHLTIVISDVITRVLSDSDLAPVPPPKKRPVAKVQRVKRPPRVVGEALIARWCVEKRYRKGVPEKVSTQTVWEMMRTRWGTMCVELGFDPKKVLPPETWHTVDAWLGRR